VSDFEIFLNFGFEELGVRNACGILVWEYGKDTVYAEKQSKIRHIPLGKQSGKVNQRGTLWDDDMSQ
jgi:hypothetical protein